MKKYGLIGYPLSHSFSREYFKNKFEKEGIQDCRYDVYEMPDFGTIHDLMADPELMGLNITIPHKVAAFRFVHQLDPIARRIGAINVMKKLKDGTWKGYNSDYFGFLSALEILVKTESWKEKNALILGSGGSSMAVAEALAFLAVKAKIVSRNPAEGQLGYQDLNEDMLKKTSLIVNCTPVGMFPHVQQAPDIEYTGLAKDGFAVDLIYNPEKTLFLKRCEEQGLKTLNGLPMLIAQAEKSWEIWQS